VLLKELLTVFGEAFGEFDTYQGAVPSDAYLRTLLSRPHFMASVAMNEEKKVVGGLVAYELQKFEKERREIHIYDLGVLESQRRKGIDAAHRGTQTPRKRKRCVRDLRPGR
jgi:aminoglycoside 3-N-acetyltransferase I